MKKTLRLGLLVLLGFGLLVGTFCLLGLRSGAASELRNYKIELKARGEKLTLAELSVGVSNNEPKCLWVITNAMAALADWPITPGNLEVRPFVGVGEAVVTWKLAQPTYFGNKEGPDWAKLVQNVTAAEVLLREVRHALQDPAVDSGPRTGPLENRRTNFVPFRQAAQWLGR